MAKDRHTRVPVNCEVCTKEFFARKERVDKGQGKFCSKECFDTWQRENAKQTWGRKDLAKMYKVGGRYSARWYDENGETKSTSYPRWWWEMNVSEIPKGMIILYKDGNSLNIDPGNFELGTKSDALRKGNATRKSDTVSWANYRNEASKRQRTLWENGTFDHIRGAGHYAWRNGASKEEYPNEFKEIREFVKSRDNFMCQICGKDLSSKSRSGRVHHRDGNKKNSSQDNLILLCIPCHAQVHAVKTAPPPIMALRSELHWNK